MPAVKQKILIVDDDSNIADLISLYLAKECFDTQIVGDGESALRTFKTYQPDLILLDLMLPGLSGEEILPRIKSIPVIVVSAKIDVDHKVNLLLDGAVDYVTKPFHTRELLARITVVLRGVTASATLLHYDGITLNTANFSVSADGKDVKLTRTEYAILKYLMMNGAQAVSKSQLLDRISLDTPDCTENSLKIHVSNLRKKLREASGKDYIEAVWGIGFKLKA